MSSLANLSRVSAMMVSTVSGRTLDMVLLAAGLEALELPLQLLRFALQQADGRRLRPECLGQIEQVLNDPLGLAQLLARPLDMRVQVSHVLAQVDVDFFD